MLSLGRGKLTQTHDKTQKLNQNPSRPVGNVGLKQGPGNRLNLHQRPPQASGKEALGKADSKTQNATGRPIQRSSSKSLEQLLERKRYSSRARTHHRNRRLEQEERQRDKQEVAQGWERLKGQRRSRYRLRQERSLYAKSRDGPPKNGVGGSTAGYPSSQQKIFPPRDQPLPQHETLHDLAQDDNKNSRNPQRRSLEQADCNEAKTHQRRSERIEPGSHFPDQQHLWVPGEFQLHDTQYHRQRGYLMTRNLQNGSESLIRSDDSNQPFKTPPIVEIVANLESEDIQRRTDRDPSQSATSERLTSGSSYEEQQQLQKLAPAQGLGQWIQEETLRWIPMRSKFIVVRRRRSPPTKQRLQSPQSRQREEKQEAESARQSTMLHTVVWPKQANSIPPTKFRVELVGETIPEIYRLRRIQRPLHQGQKSLKEVQQRGKISKTRQRTNASPSTQRVRQKRRTDEKGRHQELSYKQSEVRRGYQRRADRTTRSNTLSFKDGAHSVVERQPNDSMEMRMSARSTSGSSYEEEIEAYRLDTSQIQPGRRVRVIPTQDKWIIPKDTQDRWQRTWVRTQERHRRPNTSKSAEQSKHRLPDKNPQIIYTALWREKRGPKGYTFRQDRPPQYFIFNGHGRSHFSPKSVESAQYGRKDLVIHSRHRPEFFRYHRTRRPLRKGRQLEHLNEPKEPQLFKSHQRMDTARKMNLARLQDEREACLWVFGPGKDAEQGEFVARRLKKSSLSSHQMRKSLAISPNTKTSLVTKEQKTVSPPLDRPSGSSGVKSERSDGDPLQRRGFSRKISPYSLDAMRIMPPFSSSYAERTLHQRRTINWPPLHMAMFKGKDEITHAIQLFPKTRIEQPSQTLKATQPGIKLVSSLSKIEAPWTRESKQMQQLPSMTDASPGPVQKLKKHLQDSPHQVTRPESPQRRRQRNKKTGEGGSQNSNPLERPTQHLHLDVPRPTKLRKVQQLGHDTDANLNRLTTISLPSLAPFGLPTKLEIRPPLKFVMTTKMPVPDPIKINSKEYTPSKYGYFTTPLHRRSGQGRETNIALTQVPLPSGIAVGVRTTKRSRQTVGPESRRSALQQEGKTQLQLPQASKSLEWKISQRQLRNGDTVQLRPSSKQESSASPPQHGRDPSQSHPSSPNFALYQNSPSQLQTLSPHLKGFSPHLKSLSPHLVLKTPLRAVTPPRKARSTAKDAIFPKGIPLIALSFSSSGLTVSSSEPSTPDKSISSGASNRPEQAPLKVQEHQKHYRVSDSASDNRKWLTEPHKDVFDTNTDGPPGVGAPPVRESGRRSSWPR